MLLLKLTNFIIFSLLLSNFIINLSFMFTKKNPYKNKIISYECGFSTINQPINPFSIKFFIIGIIFLIFDLEIIYLIPWSYNSNYLTINSQFIIFIFFLFIILGLIYEWMMKGLEWL